MKSTCRQNHALASRTRYNLAASAFLVSSFAIFLRQILNIPISNWDKPNNSSSFCSSFSINHQKHIPLFVICQHQSSSSRTEMWRLSALEANVVHHLNKCTCPMARNVRRIWNVPRSSPGFCGQCHLFLG